MSIWTIAPEENSPFWNVLKSIDGSSIADLRQTNTDGDGYKHLTDGSASASPKTPASQSIKKTST